MSDTRAAIRELRSLGEKRSTQGLTEQEQSRLAELRERLGLPSEPADGRSGGPRPGSATPAAPPVPPGPSAAVGLPQLDGPRAPAPLPSFANLAPEPGVASPELPAGGGAGLESPSVPEAGWMPTPAVPDPGQGDGTVASADTALGRASPELAGDVLDSTGYGTSEETEPPTERAADALEATADGATFEESQPPPDLTADALDSTAYGTFEETEPLPELTADALASTVDGATFEENQPSPELAADALEATADGPTFEESQPPPDLTADALDSTAYGTFEETEPPNELAADALASTADGAAFEESQPPPELAADALASNADGATFEESQPPPELTADANADGATFEESQPPPELAADDSTMLATEAGAEPSDAAAAAADAGDPATQGAELAQTDGLGAAPEPAQPSPPRPLTLAERINAVVGPPDPAEEAASWGATREPILLEEEMQAEPGGETFSPADLGAIPLDVADPATESSFGQPEAPIELSAADVMLLEGEEPDLGGEPADPVPLAALHEFVGEQPFDPRALAFDDQGEEPTLAPEDLGATEAELASAAHAFHPPAGPTSLEPEPASPRIAIPRPPVGPPPSRSPPVPPRAPPEAFATENGKNLPTISAAQPEPRRAGFGQSGPFARPPAVLMAPAPLDVMEGEGMGDDQGVVAEPPLPPPPPPVTDVATGAEVFGGAYLSPTFVEGEHRVVLHTLEGQVRRGTVKDLDLLDAVIRLAQPGRAPEAIAADRVKAIFFMQEPGAAPIPSAGRRIRVGFGDGRQIVGFSEDVDSGEQGFFLVPADTRTHTARIYVFRAGVQSISAA